MKNMSNSITHSFDEKTALADVPAFFQELARQGSIAASDVQCTSDGFFAVTKSIADMLIDRGIPSLQSVQGRTLECDRFFDDWYLYALSQAGASVYGLFKMREQEYDAENGIVADGDAPGVTVSFIAFDTDTLMNCFGDPVPANQKALEEELNRVVASRGQRHNPAIKEYFKRAEAQGPYLVAELYVRKIASYAQDGCIPVPKRYAALCQAYRAARFPKRNGRLPQFIAANNEAAGHPVCSGEKIFIQNPACLSIHEKHAILATHTANVSFNSFAAEVCFHARFLTWFAKLPIPFIGHSVYDSAIRADMTIDEGEMVGPTPYYRLGSRTLRQQRKFHEDI